MSRDSSGRVTDRALQSDSRSSPGRASPCRLRPDELTVKRKQRPGFRAHPAVTDGLTGLYNRRYLFERLAAEVERGVRYQQPLSCVMIDADAFKVAHEVVRVAGGAKCTVYYLVA